MEIVGLAGGGLPGAKMGNVFHNSLTNRLESVASWSSTAFTIYDEIYVTHQTRVESGKLIIGEGLATSVAASYVGGIIPIATIDAGIDAYASSYNHGATGGLYSELQINGSSFLNLIQFGN